MSLARALWKYVFPPVNIKFSVFSVLLGFTAAVVYGYEGMWLQWGADANILLILAIVAITDFIAEGVWQHGFDILNDKSGGLSGFRETGRRAERIARAMVKFAFIWGVAATVILLYYGRIMVVVVGWMAAILAWMYSHRRNECYAAVSVALAAAGGWFTVTNLPGPQLLPVMLIAGMTAKFALSYYRYDDYKGLNTTPDFEDDMEVLVYYRNLFWIIMWYPLLAAILIAWTIFPTWTWELIVASLAPLLEIISKRRFFCHVSNH